jgi:hypothetical protein
MFAQVLNASNKPVLALNPFLKNHNQCKHIMCPFGHPSIKAYSKNNIFF